MCAQIFPIKEDISEMPYSEFQVYEMLEKLDEKFVVFHSVQWIKKSNKWKSTWKENDFLILHRNLGAIVLEVKGGEIEYSGTVFHQINTQTYDVSVLDPKKKKDPLSQAIDGVYHYRKLFDTICPDLDNRFPVEAAVCFPSCKIETKRDKFPLAYREASGAILGFEDLEKGPQVIRDVFDFYGSGNKVNITDDEFKKMVDLIATDFELITAPGVRKGELEHSFLKLTNEQIGLLDYISEQNNATIQGVAGTGKTLIAKEAARRFGLEGRKVLFLCFNKFLYIFLKRQYPYENVKYYNIHMLISEFSKHGIDLSNSVKRAKALLEIDWDLLKYDDVIIDEAQDFHNDEIIYFKELVKLRNGHFFVFYDKNQLLTTQEVPVWIRDSECKLLLTKNCRNTYEIALTAYNVIDVELKQKIMMIHSLEKTSLCFAKGEPLGKLSKLLNMLTDGRHGYEHRDIVILSLKSETDSILNGINKISGIPITREKTNSSVLFTTARKYKGLESRAVIIVDIDETCFNDEEKKRNFYVACSRATQYLALFVNGEDSKIKSIADAIGGNAHFAAKGRIAMKTQSNILDLD